MSVVAVPIELVASLSVPLAQRRLRIALGGENAVVTVGPARGPGVRWLALAGDELEAIALLDAGADDVALPDCGIALLVARIARLAQPVRIRTGALEIDPVARRIWRDGRALDLLPREYAVLRHLAAHADAVVSRSDLRVAVWGRDFDPGTNVIEVHISRVRAALDRDAPAMLLTERGRGYRLVTEPGVAERRRAS